MEGGKKSEYRYDLLNRQTYVRTLDGREQEDLYDGEGLRAGLKENGKKSVFLFHDGEILSECDGEGMPVRRHIHGAGLSHVQSLKDSAYHAYHQDEQGSTVYITGADNTVENCYRYDAFGNLTEKRESIHNRILYTGQQYDQETGQYYLRARYYNPVVGRFLQEDTYRGDGLNLYAYCANNPVGYFDPSGHEGCPGDETAKPDDTQGGQIANGDKTKVILCNKPHTNGTEGHWETILDEVEEMKKTNKYSKIYVNKGLSNEVPGAKPNRRPDIMGVRKDGLIDQVEVLSKTDSMSKLIERMKDNAKILGDKAGKIKAVSIGGK